jgi:hypothetical protein
MATDDSIDARLVFQPRSGVRIFRRYRGSCVTGIRIHGLPAVAKLLRRSAAKTLKDARSGAPAACFERVIML